MNVPRLLPLAGIAVAGVLAIKLATGVTEVQQLFGSARAFAEEALGAKDKAAEDEASKSILADGPKVTANKPAAVCAPTAAELAKEAGLSPAELQVLQSLGIRREQLDSREAGMDVQLQLLAAAEGKLDAKLKQLTALKGDITGLLHQVDAQQQAEIDRMVLVFSAMKPAAAAQRMTLLDDSVRIPVAAKMKERTLAAILAQMTPADAKKLTESLAGRFAGAQAQANAALAPAAATPPPVAPGAAQSAASPAAPLAGAAKPPAQQAAAAPPKPQPVAQPKKKAPAAKPKPQQAKAKAPPAKTGAAPPAATAAAQPPPSPAASAAAAGDTAKPSATPTK